MKNIKQENFKIIMFTLIILFSFQFESFSQIKKYKEKKSFGYLSLQTGNFGTNLIESNNYFGLNYRAKLVGNLGFETGLGFFNSDKDLLEAAKKGGSSNLDGDMADGFNFNLNINYAIPFGSNFGIVPKFGIMTSSVSSFNRGRTYNYPNEIRPVAGMDIYIKKLVLGSSFDIWYGGIFFNLGYVVNNKDKNLK